VQLAGDLLQHLDDLDFSVFTSLPPLRLIDGHADTQWHVARFGGGLPPRPKVPEPPDVPTSEETVYLSRLWSAYGDHLNAEVRSSEDLAGRDELLEHLGDSRVEFYSAEALRAFSRDTLPPGEYRKLQDEVHSGVRDDVRADHKDGYARVQAVVRTARVLQLTSHALVPRLSTRDRGGICHQLANEGKVEWVGKK